MLNPTNSSSSSSQGSSSSSRGKGDKGPSDPASYIDTRILEADLTNILYNIRSVLLSLLPVYDDIYLLHKGKDSLSYTENNKSNNNNNNNNNSSSDISSNSNGGRAGDGKVEYSSKLCISEYAVYILDNMLSRYVGNNNNSNSSSGTSSSYVGSSSRQCYSNNNNSSSSGSNTSSNMASHISTVSPLSCELFIAITGTLCFLSYIQHIQHQHQQHQITSLPLLSPIGAAYTTTTAAFSQTCAPNSDSSGTCAIPDNQGSTRPDFLLSLDPGTKLTYLANHLISLLEKAPYQRYDISILILQLLLSKPIPYLSHRRGKWYTRLCIDLEHLISAPTSSSPSQVSMVYYKYIHPHPLPPSPPPPPPPTTTPTNNIDMTYKLTGTRNYQYNKMSISCNNSSDIYSSSSSSSSSSNSSKGVADSLRLASYAFCRMALSDPLVRVRHVFNIYTFCMYACILLRYTHCIIYTIIACICVYMDMYILTCIHIYTDVYVYVI